METSHKVGDELAMNLKSLNSKIHDLENDLVAKTNYQDVIVNLKLDKEKLQDELDKSCSENSQFQKKYDKLVSDLDELVAMKDPRLHKKGDAMDCSSKSNRRMSRSTRLVPAKPLHINRAIATTNALKGIADLSESSSKDCRFKRLYIYTHLKTSCFISNFLFSFHLSIYLRIYISTLFQPINQPVNQSICPSINLSPNNNNSNGHSNNNNTLFLGTIL